MVRTKQIWLPETKRHTESKWKGHSNVQMKIVSQIFWSEKRRKIKVFSKNLNQKSEVRIFENEFYEKQSKTQLDFGVRSLLRFCTERCSTIRVKGYSNVRLNEFIQKNNKICYTENVIKRIKEKQDRYPKKPDNVRLSDSSKGIFQCTSLICPTTVFHED